jgi:hypothetical protein
MAIKRDIVPDQGKYIDTDMMAIVMYTFQKVFSKNPMMVIWIFFAL